MKKLVRRLLVDYDHYGVIAAFFWLAVGNAAFLIVLMPLEQFLKFTNVQPQLAPLLLLCVASPLVIYIGPTLWAALLLINERLWMMVGLYWLFGWEPHRFRKLIGRLVDNQS